MSLGEDNRLSILIQAKIDEASTQTMQKQLDTLSKNLKAVKIAIDLGDVEGQFLKLTKDIQKESNKMFVNNGMEVKGLDETKKSIQEIRKESEKAFKELDKLGEVKGVKNMVLDTQAGTKSFQAEVSTIKDGMEHIQRINVFGELNKDTQEWEYKLAQVGSTMKQVLSSFNYNEHTAEINKYFKEYQKGFMTVEDYYEKLQTLMKNGDAVEEMKKLPDDVRNSLEKHYTEIETKAIEHQKKMAELEKRNASFGTIDESIENIQKLGSEMDTIYNKMKKLGEVKSLDEKFDGDGNLTGYKVQIEEIRDGFKVLQNYNVLGRLKEDTNEWEYALEKAGSKVKEFSKALNSTDFAKSVGTVIEQHKAGILSLEEAYERLTVQMHKKDGSLTGHFDKMDTGAKDEILNYYNSLHKEITSIQEAQLKEQERQREEFDSKWLSSQEKKKTEEIAILKAETDAINKAVQEQGDKKLELLALEEKVDQARKEASQTISQYRNAYGDFVDADELRKIQLGFNEISVDTQGLTTNIKETEAQIKQLSKALEDAGKNAKKLQDKDTQTKEKEYEKEFQRLLKEEEQMARQSVKFEEWKRDQQYKEAVNYHKKVKALEKTYNSTKDAMDTKIVKVKYDLVGFIDESKLDEIQEAMKFINVEAMSVDLTLDEINKDINYWKNLLDDVVARAEQAKKAHDEAQAITEKNAKREIDIADRKEKVEKRINELRSSGLKVNEEELKNLAEELEKVDYTSTDAERSIRKINEKISELEKEAKQSAKQINGLGDALKKSFAHFTLYDVMQLGKDAIREMVEQVRILDDALVELQKVSDLSGNSLKSFTNDAFKVAETVGRMGSDVVQSTADFKKMGYDVEESLKLAETAMVYSNVGDNVSPEEATKTLISTMKAFNVEAKDSISIIDKINAVSNNFAISSEGLGSALQRSASALMEANNSLDQTLALYAVGNTITQDPESVSTGLRTISMRLRGVDEDTGKLIPKFRELFLEYTNGKVDIMDTNDQFKSTFDIIRDLGKEWENLSDIQQANLAELSAGKQRANIFMSLMSSSKDLEKALGVSMDSMGSAMAENEKAMDSVTGKINQLKSALQQLSINTISSDFVKGIVDMLTALVKLVDQIGLVNVALIAFGGYLALSKSNFAIGAVKGLGEAFKFLGVRIGSATVAQMGMNATMMAFAPVAIITAIMGIIKAFDLFTVTVDEQKQKVDELKGKYNDLGSQLEQLKSISNPTEAEKKRIELLELERKATAKLVEENERLLMQKEILGKGDWNPFSKGLAKDTEYTLTNDVEMTLNAIKNVEAELERMKSTGATEEMILRQEQHLQSLKDGLVSVVPELAQAQVKLTDALKLADEEEKKQIDNTIKRLDETIPLIKEITGLAEEEERLASSTGQASDSIRDASIVMEDFREEEKKQQEETSKLADEYIALTDTIKQVEEGKALTLAQAKDIVDKYGLEYSAITQVADGYGIELEALYNLKNNKLSDLEAMSRAENAHKNEAIKSILARVQAIDQEIQSYKDLLKAKQKLVSAMSSVESNAQKAKEKTDPLGLMSGNYLKDNLIDGITEDITSAYQSDLDVINQAIKDWEEIENATKDSQQALNNLLGGYKGTLSSSQKKPKEKKGKSQSYISDNLDILIDDILKKGEEVERAISFTTAKLDNAIAKGDKANELTLKEALVEHMQDRVKTTADTANQLRAEGEKLIKTLGSTGLFKGKDLKQLTEKQLADVVRTLEVKSQSATDSQAESLNLLKSKVEEYGQAIIRIYQDELPSLSQQWWDYENERISQAVGLVDEKYDRENKLREDALRDIELQQLLVEENSEAHINLEKQKYQLLLKQQADAKEAMRKLKEEGLDEDSEDARRYLNIWYDAERAKRNMLKSFAQQQADLRKEQINLEKEQLEESKEGLETLLDMTINMLKQEEEAKKKAFQEELNGYKKIIDAKKQSLKDEKSERDHAKNLEDKQKAIKKVEDKILELSNDNSAKAMAEKRKLEEELVELKEDLADYQYEHSLEKQEEALDKEYDAFEENINKELKKIEDYLSKEGNLRAEAIKLIESKNKDLYDKLIKWNQEYGDGVDTTVTEAWETAHKAMESYNNGQMNVLNTLENITQKMKDLNTELKNMNSLSGTQIPEDWITDGNIQDKPDGGTIKPQGEEYQKLIDEIAPQMNRNSDAWLETEDKNERDRLAKENERLAKKIGAWKDEKGNWWVTKEGIGRIKLKDLYPEYHTGGIVGGQPNLKSTEEFAKLLKGEVVSTEPQIDKFMKTTLPNIANQNIRSGVELQIDRFIDITVEGNLDNSVDIEAIIKRASAKALDNLVNTISNRGIKQRIGII